MKILHFGDLHIKLKQDKRYKKDLINIIRYILDVIKEERPDIVLAAGDIFDNKHPTPTESSLANAFIRRILDLGAELVLIPGNHDLPPQAGAHHNLHPLDNLKLKGLHVLSETDIYNVKGIDILAVPYVYLDQEAAKNRVKELHDSYAGQNLFLLGHAWVEGYMQVVPPSQEYVLSSQLIRSLHKVKYGAFGHIHHGGQIYGNFIYAGSPFRCSLGETSDKYLYQWEDGIIKRFKTPALPILTIDYHSIPENIEEVTGHIIRLIAKNITVDVLPKISKLTDILTEKGNYVYTDVDLQKVTFASAQENTVLTIDQFAKDWLKKNDLVGYGKQIMAICNRIQSGEITSDTSPFDIPELEIKSDPTKN